MIKSNDEEDRKVKNDTESPIERSDGRRKRSLVNHARRFESGKNLLVKMLRRKNKRKRVLRERMQKEKIKEIRTTGRMQHYDREGGKLKREEVQEEKGKDGESRVKVELGKIRLVEKMVPGILQILIICVQFECMNPLCLCPELVVVLFMMKTLTQGCRRTVKVLWELVWIQTAAYVVRQQYRCYENVQTLLSPTRIFVFKSTIVQQCLTSLCKHSTVALIQAVLVLPTGATPIRLDT